jgi:hypothetical protein
MTKIAGFALLLVFVAGDSAVARDCGGRVRFINGVTVNRRIELSPGQKCSFTLRLSRGPMEGIRVTESAKHGKASTSGPHRVTYVAARGNAGEDTFVYERYGLDTLNRPLTAPVRVSVKIVK